MQSIKEIILDSPVTAYTGSETTRAMIEEQIKERWGETEVKNFDPRHSARTFKSWVNLGYRVKKSEKALKSITYVEVKDAEGNVTKKYKRPCFLFYYRQVEKITNEDNKD
jgi:cell division protein FtsX